MKYVGSKNKLSKELTPIIQSYITKDIKGYLEPFVGGANMIDKIQCKKRIGCDIHEELIELLKYTQEFSNLLPKTISEDTYNEVKHNKEKYEKWYVGLVGFCASFGAQYFTGYARAFKADKVTRRDMPNEAIRNLKKQAPNLEGIEFKCTSFLDLPLDKIKDYVIYCDIPYKGTSKYKTEEFPYEEFYKWVKEASVHNTVLISEYNMPDEFKCIWSKEVKCTINNQKVVSDNVNKNRTEKLFTYKK